MEKGVTIAEIIVTIFLIILFTTIVVFSLNGIQGRMALSRAAHNIAQNIRTAQDLALSGAGIKDSSGNILKISGYGLYVNILGDARCTDKQVLIYADSCTGECLSGVSDKLRYTAPCGLPCANGDYIVKCIDIGESKQKIVVKRLENISGQFVSINFSPPNPLTTIENATGSRIGIVIGLENDNSVERIIWVNKAGMVEVE